MSDLRTELDQLEDLRINYVIARAKVNSDAQGYKLAGIAKTSFYTWSAEERERLNNLAQRIKREVALRIMIQLQDAAEQAANVKVDGLKSRNEHVKQNSATEILDRVLGRPTQRQELTGAEGMPLKIIIDWDGGDDANGSED